MITGITVPANNRLQRTMIGKVPRYDRQRAPLNRALDGT